MPIRTGLIVLLAPVFLASSGATAGAVEGTRKPLPVTVEGTNLVVRQPDGRLVEGKALVGAMVVGGAQEANRESLEGIFRIDGVRVDPDDPEITLYDLAIRDPNTGAWQPYCVPDERGVSGGFFLAGSWDQRGTHLRNGKFSATCTSGALGKCVRWGYKPWKAAPDGRPGWDYHQACVRLVRADYCGNGRTHTRTGVEIEIISRFDPKQEPGTHLVLEAAWTPEGAACLARPRLVTWSLDAIAAECPERLRGGAGDPADCGMAELGRPDVLFVNKSRPDTR